MKDPNNGVTTYQWCACGTMDALIDANGNKTSWEYDLQRRVVKEIRADASPSRCLFLLAVGRRSRRRGRKRRALVGAPS